jgi:hypothetical protein
MQFHRLWQNASSRNQDHGFVRAAHGTNDRNRATWISRETPMRKIRNPRYAPEFLERKLSPTSFMMAPATAQVATMSDPTPTPAPTPSPTPTDPSDPTTPPTDPSGPSGPSVMTYSTYSAYTYSAYTYSTYSTYSYSS